MPYVLLPTTTVRVGGVNCINTWPLVAESTAQPPLTPIVTDAMDWLSGVIIPNLANILSDQVEVIEYGCSVLTQPSYSQSAITNVPGEVVSATATTLPSHLAVYVRENVGESYWIDGNAPYTGIRRIRRGGTYLSGLTEDWIQEAGAAVPAGLITAFNSLFNSHISGFEAVASGIQFSGCVWGMPLPAIGPSPSYPDGKPSRPYVYALIETFGVVNITRLKSRLA